MLVWIKEECPSQTWQTRLYWWTKTIISFNSVYFQTALSGSINGNKTNQLNQTICSSEFHFPGFPVRFVTNIWLLAWLGRYVGWPVPRYYCGFPYCKCLILLVVLISNVSWGNSWYFATPLLVSFHNDIWGPSTEIPYSDNISPIPISG